MPCSMPDLEHYVDKLTLLESHESLLDDFLQVGLHALFFLRVVPSSSQTSQSFVIESRKFCLRPNPWWSHQELSHQVANLGRESFRISRAPAVFHDRHRAHVLKRGRLVLGKEKIRSRTLFFPVMLMPVFSLNIVRLSLPAPAQLS